jgi:anaerobic selenocysteine-containing dehydrogenase
VLSTPNGKRLDRALARLDHLVAVDPYLNETTRHADVVLPPVPPLARSHYGLAVYAFAVRNVARFAAPVVRPPAGTRQDWEIVSELAARTLASPGLRRLAARAARLARPERILDVLLRSGPHRTSLAALRRAPHGVDLGALEPGRLPARLETADGLLDLAPDDFVAEARVALAAEAEAEETGGLVLIGRRDLRSNNSWMHNAGRLTRGDDRCTLLVHPEDAVARGLVTGDRARLASGTGAVEVPVEVTASVRVGVVSLPHGWGRTSANDVTSEYHLDALSALSGVLSPNMASMSSSPLPPPSVPSNGKTLTVTISANTISATSAPSSWQANAVTLIRFCGPKNSSACPSLTTGGKRRQAGPSVPTPSAWRCCPSNPVPAPNLCLATTSRCSTALDIP